MYHRSYVGYDRIQSRVQLDSWPPCCAHPKVNIIKRKAIDSRSKIVLCAIIGCGTRSVRD